VLLAVDVHYQVHAATTACVAFAAWTDAEPVFELVLTSQTPPAEYEPGHFYKRELPHVIAAVEAARARSPIDLVVIDAYVSLDAGRPGLGAHVHRALAGQVAVVGVAKTAFRGADALAVARGTSASPLFVSAIGIDAARAAELVRGMHGAHRVPTLLKRTDQLARGIAAATKP
jgi:deoxyribonuclease V